MKLSEPFKSLTFSTEGDTDPTVTFVLPEQLSADTQDWLLDQITELVLLFRKRLRYVLKEKYDVKYCMHTAILEKVQKPDTEDATNGVT